MLAGISVLGFVTVALEIDLPADGVITWLPSAIERSTVTSSVSPPPDTRVPTTPPMFIPFFMFSGSIVSGLVTVTFENTFPLDGVIT